MTMHAHSAYQILQQFYCGKHLIQAFRVIWLQSSLFTEFITLHLKLSYGFIKLLILFEIFKTIS